LSSNLFENLNENVFEKLEELTLLSLSSCKLKKLKTKIFFFQQKLYTIDLYENELEHLDKDLFANNLNLADVDIRYNKLKTIEVDFTKKKIQYLSLDKNVCIDSSYGTNWDTDTKSLQEIQQIIDRNCSAKSN
jgi:hypothetical protein